MFVFVLTLFLRGAAPPVIPPAYGAQISKAVGQGVTGDSIPCAVGRGASGGGPPPTEFAISRVSLYAQKIEGKRNDK